MIKGNIAATTGAVNRVDKNGTLTQINLGLATKESSLTGAVYNAFPEEGTTSGDLTFTGEVNMWLQNGATWNNQVQGQIGSSSGGKSFEGSIVSNLVGGDSADKAGSDSKYGARPLRRALRKLVEDPLSDLFLTGKFHSGDKIIAEATADKKLDFHTAIERAQFLLELPVTDEQTAAVSSGKEPQHGQN